MLMAVMMTPRETWTDQRLDDLNKKVDEGFADNKAEIADTKVEMRGRFDCVEVRIDAQFAQMNARFDRMQYTLIGGGAVIVAALIGVIATQL